MSIALYWFRNDLRLHDNEVLTKAVAAHDQVFCCYTLNRSLFKLLPGPNIKKTGPHRARFLLESLTNLSKRLMEHGGNLEVAVTNDVGTSLAAWVETLGAGTVYAQKEYMWEELEEEESVARNLPPDCQLVFVEGRSLYHPDDVPFPANGCPEPYKAFRTTVTPLPVRAPLPAPERIPTPDFNFSPVPALEELGFRAEEASPAYPGGEEAGLARLSYYLEETGLVKNYRYTRNRSLGADYSTKFSPYLALGCLSPRLVYQRITDYGKEYKNRGGSSIIFEMRWRDFFLYLGRKHGDRVFRPGGLRNKETAWAQDHELFDNWRKGNTGIPFVDAHMRELDATGFMSNRGRVNCASFLTRDYKIDWRWGAAWFENRLIDYEVSANWFNWQTQALEIYYTSAPWQGLKYDKKGVYVKKWLPELAPLPAPLVHAPWKMEEEGLLEGLDFDLDQDYFRPSVGNSKWDWAWGRLKSGDASSPRRKKKKA